MTTAFDQRLASAKRLKSDLKDWYLEEHYRDEGWELIREGGTGSYKGQESMEVILRLGDRYAALSYSRDWQYGPNDDFDMHEVWPVSRIITEYVMEKPQP